MSEFGVQFLFGATKPKLLMKEKEYKSEDKTSTENRAQSVKNPRDKDIRSTLLSIIYKYIWKLLRALVWKIYKRCFQWGC